MGSRKTLSGVPGKRGGAAGKTAGALGMLSLMAAIPLQAVNLGDADTGNQVQKQTGDYIDTICPQMAAIQDQLSDPQKRLFQRCRGAKFDQEGQEGFTEGDTPGVLQRLSPEETLTIGSERTDTALHNQLDTRFQAIRQGVTGVSIAGVPWSEQTGGTAGSDDFLRWGFFLNGVYATGDKDASKNENQFDFDAYGLTTGLDYRFSDNFVAGIAYSYVDSEADIDDRQGDVAGGRGDGEQDTDSHTFALYSTWYQDNFYFDGSLSYSTMDIEGERDIQYGNVNQTAVMDTDGEQWGFNLGGGYNHHLGGPWNARYFARLDYVDVEIDGYKERAKQQTAAGADPTDAAADKDSLIMQVFDQDLESLQSVLGVNFTYVASTDFGVLTPYFTAEWYHEFEDDERNITAKYVFDPTNDVLRFRSNAADEDFFGISLGVNSVLKGGAQLFFNYDTVLDLEDVTQHIFTAGVRYEF